MAPNDITFADEESAAKERDIYITENFPDSHYTLNFP